MADLLTPSEEYKSKIITDNSDIVEELRQIELKEKLKKKTQPKVEEVETLIIQSIKEDVEGFIYVPSINLYVAKERSFLGKTWIECQEILHKENQKMLNLPEFLEFLKYTRKNYQDVYEEITKVKNPLRGEWLDAEFSFDKKVFGEKTFYSHFHVFNNRGKIEKKKEKLDKDTFLKHVNCGFFLEGLLINNTKQGLPTTSTPRGWNFHLHYIIPLKNSPSVAEFSVNSDFSNLLTNQSKNSSYEYCGARICFQKF